MYIFMSDDAQTALATAQEKERAATEHALEANTRITSLGSQLATYRQEKSRLEALLEMERARFEAAEEGKSRYMWAAEWVEEAFITAPRKLGQTKTKHTTGKSKPKLVRGPVVRGIHQSIAKRHQFENCYYYKVLYGR